MEHEREVYLMARVGGEQPELLERRGSSGY